jgi:hypothetical protein
MKGQQANASAASASAPLAGARRRDDRTLLAIFEIMCLDSSDAR